MSKTQNQSFIPKMICVQKCLVDYTFELL